MKTTIDYSKSPAKRFDAVEDIKEYLGPRFDQVSAMMKQITDRDQFAAWCSFAGIEGFPVEAWYDLYHGEGSYRATP